MSEHEIPVEEMEVAAGGGWTEEIVAVGDEVLRTVNKLVREVNVRRVTVRTAGGRKLLDLPLYAGTLGVFLLGPWTALPLALALVTECSIIVERRDDPAADRPAAPAALRDEDEIVPVVGDPDDLTRVKGIGPKTAALLNEAGITTYAQLAAADAAALRAVLAAAGSRYRIIDPTDWPAQAADLA